MNSTLLRLRLRVRAPFLFKSGASLPLGLDAATLEDQEGHALIPGTHLRGHLSHALREFAHYGALTKAWIDAWFGAESQADSNDAPKRGRLDFDAYWKASPDGAAPLPRNQWMPLPSASFTGQSATRYRVRIDDTTGTADPGALQLIGQTHAAGTLVNFDGYINIEAASESELKEIERWLRKALEWIPGLGALKGIGFGRLESYELKRETDKTPALEPPANADSLRALALSFQLDRPYCFGARAIESNRFESVPYVPGGALRGALFEWCNRVRALAMENQDGKDARLILEQAASIHIRHAWASGDARTPAVVPESAVYADKALVDASVAPWNQPFILKRGSATVVPVFPIDWKHEGDAFAKAHDHKIPESWTEVRTAISAETQSAAEEKLFSYDARQPSDADGPYTFRTVISLYEPSNSAELWPALARVLPRALKRLGKTEARALQVTLTAAAPVSTPPPGRVVLCLQSDALLCQTLAGPMADAQTLLQAYRAYFQQLSPHAPVLTDLFVDQKLAGGEYFRKRYWSQDPSYRARVLTKAGSVFVFDCPDSHAAEVVRHWLEHGIPPAEAEEWQHNPYLRANGYGEVRLGTGIRITEVEGDVEELTDAATSQEITP